LRRFSIAKKNIHKGKTAEAHRIPAMGRHMAGGASWS
jgi:hypothetical protein